MGRQRRSRPSGEASGPAENAPVVSATDIETTSVRVLGLDVGTVNIAASLPGEQENPHRRQTNAFFTVPANPAIREILNRKEMGFLEKDGTIYITGHGAERIARRFGRDTRRPIRSGLINPREQQGMNVLERMLADLLPPPGSRGIRVGFSIPGEPQGRTGAVIYHQAIIQMCLEKMGYQADPVNEGLAVILSELGEDNHSGIGVSMGGGMCNVCLAYLGIPVMEYSIQFGGDTIDTMTAQAIETPATTVKAVKETSLDLTRAPNDQIETALQIYYADLFRRLATSLEKQLNACENIGCLPESLPLVLSGGTVMVPGSADVFKRALDSACLPVAISDVILASDPLMATANGALKHVIMQDAA